MFSSRHHDNRRASGPDRRTVLLSLAGGVALVGCESHSSPATTSIAGMPPAGASTATAPATAGSSAPAVLGEQRFPKAWFFRQAETVTKVDYDTWLAAYGGLGGVEVKVLPDDLPSGDRDTLRQYVTRLKREHPEQLALMHVNGKGRRPATDVASLRIGDFSAGHWLYYAGTTVTQAAGRDATTLRVADGSRIRMGRMAGSKDGDDVVIVPRASGRLDWARAEHATVTAVSGGAVTLRRGRFGSRAIDVPQGAYVAAHVRFRPPALEGGDGREPETVWLFNYATTCPRDARGHTLADVLVEQFRTMFSGDYAAFDGIAFDVAHFWCTGGTKYRLADDAEHIDVDNDGSPDQGFVGGANAYGRGVTAFHAALRRALPGKVLVADGYMDTVYQRSTLSLDGMESEGFPEHGDLTMQGWSGGLNAHAFWNAQVSGRPRLSYMVYKYLGKGVQPPGPDNLDDFRRVRMEIAAACLTGSAFVPGGQALARSLTGTGQDPKSAIHDELVAGADRRAGWLGRPRGGAVHLAGRGASLTHAPADRPAVLAGRVDGARADGAALVLRGVASPGRSPDTRLPLHVSTLRGLRGGGPVHVELRASASAPAGYETQNARHAWVSVHAPGQAPTERIHALVGAREAAATFLFRTVPSGPLELTIEVEGPGEVRVSRLVVTRAADGVYRDFEGGIVLANPGDSPYEFDLDDIAGRSRGLRRIRATAGQDAGTNDGRAVERRGGRRVVRVPARDALFLVNT